MALRAGFSRNLLVDVEEALALRAGFSRNLLVDVELGKSGLLYERLFDLAAALGVEAHVLLDIGPDQSA
ncbi:helix-turn-helix transcriptional regulator [Mycolicibacterium sp. CBMA 361]|uniref:helix-turn-helix transcriptional regulator n=1 Tax=Mycolicibacterium sp. CBMA 361 TaxID=2606610 RepID=UPI001396BA1E|nr:helix-turn-helix transcriptional regulator [Mycolicibacterium sp. CBMA 361]MUM30795.1 helix-turn-helix transcriptional regulator [Mycolicibacterium sp. CBMA 361]